MQLTKKASYGLIAALELAGATSDCPIAAGRIADKYALPLSFTEKILRQLRSSRLVAAKPGRGGGYYLADSPEDVTLRQIIEALEGPVGLVGCLTTEHGCTRTAICPTKTTWRRLDRQFKEMLDSVSLQSLLDDE